MKKKGEKLQFDVFGKQEETNRRRNRLRAASGNNEEIFNDYAKKRRKRYLDAQKNKILSYEYLSYLSYKDGEDEEEQDEEEQDEEEQDEEEQDEEEEEEKDEEEEEEKDENSQESNDNKESSLSSQLNKKRSEDKKRAPDTKALKEKTKAMAKTGAKKTVKRALMRYLILPLLGFLFNPYVLVMVLCAIILVGMFSVCSIRSELAPIFGQLNVDVLGEILGGALSVYFNIICVLP